MDPLLDELTGSSAVDRRCATVGAGQQGRLDRFLAAVFPDLSRSRLKDIILGGGVTVGAEVIRDPARKLVPGDVCTVVVPVAVPAVPVPQAIPLDVVFEDDCLIVIDKPPGLVVHPGAGNEDGTLVNALLAHCGPSLSGIGGVLRPGIVHRLDKDTSGLMVAAKTDRAHAGLAAQFADRRLSRTYLALVRGVPLPATGRIDAAIGRHPRHRQRMAVVGRGGRSAATRYAVDRAFGRTAATVSCTLETGRTHQIRVHMASIGHPIVGDPLYGRPPAGADPVNARLRAFPRQALHATRLALRHPVNGEALVFERPVPADMAALIADLASASAGILD